METKFHIAKNGKIHVHFAPPLTASTEKRIDDPLAVISPYFSNVIGMHDMMTCMKEIYAVQITNNYRRDFHLLPQKQMLHMVFSGNPGTGKTTIARIVATILKDLAILPKGHFIECDRSALVGEYIGETAQKTNKMIDKALGGVLFIDEAYALARGGEKDFGKEAIDTLVKRMEDHYEELAVILAGYTKEMDYFLSMNPGLASRFAYHHTFTDYTIDQLLDIAEQMIIARDYQITSLAKKRLREKVKREKEKETHVFANGRFIRNMVEEIIRKHSIRIASKQQVTRKMVMEIHAQDII